MTGIKIRNRRWALGAIGLISLAATAAAGLALRSTESHGTEPPELRILTQPPVALAAPLTPGAHALVDLRTTRLALTQDDERYFVGQGKDGVSVCLVVQLSNPEGLVSTCNHPSAMERGIIFLSTPVGDYTAMKVVGIVGNDVVSVSFGGKTSVPVNNVVVLDGVALQRYASVAVAGGPDFVADLGPPPLRPNWVITTDH